jgi:hypothetical protein
VLVRLGLWSPRRFAAAGVLLAGSGLGLIGIVAQWSTRTEFQIRYHWLPLTMVALAIGVLAVGFRLWEGKRRPRRDPTTPTTLLKASRIPTVRRR